MWTNDTTWRPSRVDRVSGASVESKVRFVRASYFTVRLQRGIMNVSNVKLIDSACVCVRYEKNVAMGVCV